MQSSSTTYTFHVHGMHCQSCILVIEQELAEAAGVEQVRADLSHRTVTITGNFVDQSPAAVAAILTPVIAPHGYTLSQTPARAPIAWSQFRLAVPIALAFAVLFVLLQKIGLINIVDTDHIGYGTAAVLGVIASLSTCMAVVGGLLLSMSATFAKEGDRVRPQLLFHSGRLVSFFVFGGIIGLVGSAFALSTTATFALGMVIGLVMLILGVNLLDVFPWAKRLQPAMPRAIAKRAHNVAAFRHTVTPLLVGIATFFLPCGFTQSMQLYTLTTGSFMRGALTMLVYALGTLPVLALISFSSYSIQKRATSGIFFKTAGLIVILFALFNIINSLAVIGVIPPLFNL